MSQRINALFSVASLTALASLALFGATAHAATVYTSPADFLPLVAAGSYTETFSIMVPDSPFAAFTSPLTGFGYTVTGGTGDIYINNIIGNDTSNTSLTFTFTGAPVTAIGGNFFTTDISDGVKAGPISITLSDGTVESYTSSATTPDFRGFISDVPITSFTLAPGGNGNFNTVDNLVIGQAAAAVVPESGSFALALPALAMVGAVVIKRRKK